jgi:hypothetical protein
MRHRDPNGANSARTRSRIGTLLTVPDLALLPVLATGPRASCPSANLGSTATGSFGCLRRPADGAEMNFLTPLVVSMTGVSPANVE